MSYFFVDSATDNNRADAEDSQYQHNNDNARMNGIIFISQHNINRWRLDNLFDSILQSHL